MEKQAGWLVGLDQMGLLQTSPVGEYKLKYLHEHVGVGLKEKNSPTQLTARTSAGPLFIIDSSDERKKESKSATNLKPFPG